MIDSYGNLVSVLKDEFLLSGEYSENVKLPNLQSGMYLIRAKTEKYCKAEKLLVTN